MSELPRTVRVITGGACDLDAVDSVALDFHHRHRRRMQMCSESGKSFLLDLEKAVALLDNDVLELDDGTMVVIRAKAERVADIRADDPRLFARIAWHLGNRHLPTQILDDRLRIAYDHVIVDMVQGLGATVSIVDAPFQPEGGAYAHAHAHEHHE
jgi:urease accessory protein